MCVNASPPVAFPCNLNLCISKQSSSSLFYFNPLDNHRFSPIPLTKASSPEFSPFQSIPTEMDMIALPGLFPLHRCKTIHLIRHAQGVHNIEGDSDYKAYMKPEYFDANLTPLGWHQVDNLRKHVEECGLLTRIELVVVSPLMRTMQTAAGVFGSGSLEKTVEVPLMAADAGDSGREAVSGRNSPPILAVELCREHFGVHPCDKRRDVSEYKRLFPGIDFSLIETDEDTLWKSDVRETKEELASRGLVFINWLLTRPEKEIAVVTHSGLLFHTLNAFGKECHPLVKKEICERFANCELRSLVVADKSMVVSIKSTSDYSGRDECISDVRSGVNNTNGKY